MLISFQLIEASDLEPSVEESDPVKFHSAWSTVCSAQYVVEAVAVVVVDNDDVIFRSYYHFEQWFLSRLLLHHSGMIVAGGFGSRGIEGKIAAAQYARTHKIPYLGLCLGLQIAVIGLLVLFI